MSTDCNTTFGEKSPRDLAYTLLFWRLAQDQVARGGGKGKWKLPDSIFHPHVQKKILVLLPRPDPFVLGPEEDPAVRFGITGVERGGCQILAGEKFDEFGGFLLVLTQERRFFFGCLRIFLDLAFGHEDFCIHI